ncbi:uncharacterized protein BDZ99DRAFT_501973 [Mytilinidion resinicola]|uniref:Cleavage/polyadenylation specificity factor A subunit N-terminal domain-containing protein n=1 Tax=Mytilinidion resinicola TaxID=574789 RepID=A0A6A6Y967_9PEZI|nr:uncharacterized protein BDZ99DRAFT_501973 [Mytilinidion resinicola]KAF2805093.1 hypothetical protein BDZ99DRAFT_501973 [Mytilinidion resinicola]
MASVATNVFVNGQWETRHVNLDEILENDRRKTEAAAKSRQQKPPEPTPTLGLLSRTILRSPIINWIIPARIRHKYFNDVVFIGEDFLHIKEIGSDGHLRHIASKTDFDSRIRAARCFGEPRKPAFNSQLKREANGGLKEEPSDVIPPQVLVLTLESQRVVFLYARQGAAGCVTFIQSTNPLPFVSFLENPGKHLAVDPKSRAIAIGASEELFLIYTTKSMAAWRMDILSAPDTDLQAASFSTPKVEERAFKVDKGVILKMEFLSPAASDVDRVVLLVLFSIGGRTKMSCYEWDANSTILGPQSSVVVRLDKYPLDIEDAHPLFLIPLRQSPDFLLVGEHIISLYRDVLTGSPRRHGNKSEPKILRYSGSSRRKPLLTHWARTARNWEPEGKLDESIYLVREDGTVLYAVVHPNASLVVVTSAGQLNCIVDSAFASLNVGFSLMSPDVLIAAGDMSHGEIVKIGQWSKGSQKMFTRTESMELEYIESLPNWTPLMDTVVSRLPGVKSKYERSRDTILTTSGRAPYGSISEIRYGLNARIWAEADLSGSLGNTGMWALFDPTQEGVFFLVSHPWQTRLYHLSIESMEVSEIEEQNCDLELNKETFAACTLSLEWAVQVTENALHLLSISAENPQFRRVTRHDFPSDRPVRAATVDSRWPLIVLATRQGSEFGLELRHFAEPGDGTGCPNTSPSFVFQAQIPLSAEPTCVQLVDIHGKPYVFVGTRNAELLLFSLAGGDFVLVLEKQVEAGFMQGIPAVCESVALLSSDERGEYTLVCGMRNGCVYNLNLEEHHTNPTISATNATIIPMGHTSARVIQCFSEPSTAFVMCGSECCRLKRSETNDSTIRYETDNIWFTDQGNPALQQPAVSALSQVPHWPRISPEGFSLGGSLLAISDSTFFLAQLEDEVKAVPRRLLMRDTPYKLIYSPHLKMMVVAAFRIKEKKGKKGFGIGGFRSVRSVIQLIRSDSYATAGDDDDENTAMEDEPKSESDKTLIAGEFVLYPHEKVYAFLEWHWEEGTKKHDFLVVGTGITNANGDLSGRLIFLQIKFDGQGKAEFRESKKRDLRHPVFAIANYDERHMIYTCGTTAQLEEFSAVESRWLLVSQYTLPSPGLHITVQGPSIYISTAQDSVYALGIGLSSSSKPILQPFFSDAGTRNTLNHLTIRLPPIKFDVDRQTTEAASSSPPAKAPRTLILISDKSSTLVGLLQPSQEALKNAASTLFEARLPRCVTRLRRGAIRPSWRRYHPKSFDTSHLGVPQRDLSADHPEDPPTTSPVSGILVDDIIGTAVDGTLFAFSILDQPAWRLLKFLETLITVTERQYASARVSWTHISLQDVVEGMEKDKGHPKPPYFHVNGDLLASRITETRAPVTELRILLFDGPEEELRVFFFKLAAEFLPAEKPGEGLETWLIERCVEWLREVLDAVL